MDPRQTWPQKAHLNNWRFCSIHEPRIIPTKTESLLSSSGCDRVAVTRCGRVAANKAWQDLKRGGNMNRYLTKGMRAISCAVVFLVVQFVGVKSSHAQIVALGASVVQGYGVSSGEAFPQQLEAMLRAKGKQYSVSNQGVFGDTTTGVLGRIDSAVPQGTRIVILLIGGNDVRRGATVKQAKGGMAEIIARLQARKVRVINAAPYYAAARSKGMVLSDRIHLTAEGQRYMAAQLLPLIN
jgi:acyl-CoA thioesterase-1